MGKINFNRDHFDSLSSKIVSSVLTGDTIQGSLGTSFTVYDLVNNTTISTLRNIRTYLAKKISSLQGDDWGDNPNKELVAKYQDQDELINLIIGYRLYQEEIKEAKKEKESLEEQLRVLEDSEKSPAQKIAELKEKIASITV